MKRRSIVLSVCVLILVLAAPLPASAAVFNTRWSDVHAWFQNGDWRSDNTYVGIGGRDGGFVENMFTQGADRDIQDGVGVWGVQYTAGDPSTSADDRWKIISAWVPAPQFGPQLLSATVVGQGDATIEEYDKDPFGWPAGEPVAITAGTIVVDVTWTAIDAAPKTHYAGRYYLPEGYAMNASGSDLYRTAVASGGVWLDGTELTGGLQGNGEIWSSHSVGTVRGNITPQQ